MNEELKYNFAVLCRGIVVVIFLKKMIGGSPPVFVIHSIRTSLANQKFSYSIAMELANRLTMG